MMEGGLIKFLARGATCKVVEDPRDKAELLVDTFQNNLQNRVAIQEHLNCIWRKVLGEFNYKTVECASLGG